VAPRIGADEWIDSSVPSVSVPVCFFSVYTLSISFFPLLRSCLCAVSCPTTNNPARGHRFRRDGPTMYMVNAGYFESAKTDGQGTCFLYKVGGNSVATCHPCFAPFPAASRTFSFRGKIMILRNYDVVMAGNNREKKRLNG
jgi:hypothetical protein